MKELSIKQKANAYDKAIEVARTLLNTRCVEGTNGYFHKKDIEQMFPSLVENEDERIRKDILSFAEGMLKNNISKTQKDKFASWITWLEKQGEQQSIITPNFRIGDTIKNKITKETFTISGRCLSLGYYYDKNHEFEVKFSEQDNWTLVEPSSKPVEWSEDERIRKGLIDYFNYHRVGIFCGIKGEDILSWLEKKGEPLEINPTEFDLRLNSLLRQFESLSKEELANSLSFYLNVVQNNGIYNVEEKQGEQKLVESNKGFEDFVRWFVKQRTDDYTLIPSDDDIHKWSILILEHAKNAIVEKKPTDKAEPKLTDGFGQSNLGLSITQIQAIEKYVKKYVEFVNS